MQNQKVIALFGGGGYVSKHLLRSLTRLDYRVKIATRSPYLNNHLKILGSPGQVELFKCNPFDEKDVKKVLTNVDICINTIGILFEKKQNFHQVHVQIPILLSNICNELGVGRLIQISALSMDGNTSKYMTSKREGEIQIAKIMQGDCVILRPSLIIGPSCPFFSMFGSLSQWSPVLPLIGNGRTKFAPIYVENVCQAIVKSLELNSSKTKIFEIFGPDIFTFKELLQLFLKEIKKKRILLPIPWGVAKLQSYLLQLSPNPLLTPDMVENLQYDNIASGNNYPNLKDMGINPAGIENILKKLKLWQYRSRGQFG